MKPGDIVLIRFPQADLTAGKLRPALIVAIAPGRHADLLLALITSSSHQIVPNFDEVIEPSAADYAQTGLKTRSVIRLARLITVESAVINARLSAVSKQRLAIVRKKLADWLTAKPQ